VREHLRRVEPDVAESLGLYDEARTVDEERKGIERELAESGADFPKLPSLAEIRRRSTACLEHLEDVLAGATIEEKRELVQKYVRAVKACPDTQKVEIRLYTALFNDLVAGAGCAARRRWRRPCEPSAAPPGRFSSCPQNSQRSWRNEKGRRQRQPS